MQEERFIFWKQVYFTLFFLFFFTQPVLASDISLNIIDTYPTSPATLGYWGQFYLRVQCDTPQLIKIKGTIFLNEKNVTDANSTFSYCDPTSNEAIVWFANTHVAEANKIIISAYDVKTNALLIQKTTPVNLQWTGQKQITTEQPPNWVTRLSEKNTRDTTEAIEVGTKQATSSIWGKIVIGFIMNSVLPYFILQILMLFFLHGKWRKAAAIPLAFIVLTLIYVGIAVYEGSNIAPVVLFFVCPLALIYLLVLLSMRIYMAWKNRG